MFLRIEKFSGKKMTGKKLNLSFAHNRTVELWKSFQPERKQIKNAIGTELYSREIYPANYFSNFNPEIEFEKWAAVEVSDFIEIPPTMETLHIPSGTYAVFLHRGPAAKGNKTYQYIFQNWLPASSWQIDQRPHFAVMGEKYRHDSEDSEEEIWIPVK